MRREVAFVVNGRPVPQPRYAQGVSKGGRRVAWIPRVVDPMTKRKRPHPIHAWKQLVALRAKAARHQSWPLECRLSLSLEFYVKARAGHQPDLDNLIKAAKDAMTGIVYKDDALVRSYHEPIEIVDVDDAAAEALVVGVEWGEE